MHGRRLATVEEIITIRSPGSEQALQELRAWTKEHNVALHLIEVGEEIDNIYQPERETLGVTLGGDGTYLEGIRVFTPKRIPMLGINTGTLAFLASVSPSVLRDALTEIIRGNASVNDCQQLYISAGDLQTMGINDVMIEHAPPDNPVDRKITRLEVFVDGEYVGEYEGSGVAVSTPTGSTGVALSAGGPIHYPKGNSTVQIVPLHTHRMGVRPVVTSSDVEIQIATNGPANLLVDGGRSHAALKPDETVTVTGAATPAHIVSTSYDDHFFTSISEKLGWGIRDGKKDVEERSQINPPSARSTLSSDFLSRAKQIAIEAARSAGDPLRELHGDVEHVTHKSDKSDIVTEADYQADNIITTAITNEFPDHDLYSEESVRNNSDSSYTWMIDPLDGTGNFAHGNPNYAISIGLLEDGLPILGVVYAPETDEMFCAVQGSEAERNGQSISTTDREQLDESMLLSGYDPDGTFLTHCYQESRGVRRLGSAALHLCYLASGSADAVWEFDTYPWDVTAGIVIARAAGAKVTDLTGSRYVINKEDRQSELLATNGSLHKPLIDHLATDSTLKERVSGD